MQRVIQMAGLLTVAATAMACSSSTDSGTGGTGGTLHQVQATADLAFTPSSVRIGLADTVAWVFASVGHNVTFDAANGSPATIGGSNRNVTISRTFPNAGTFTYHCTIHPAMTGTISVSAPD